MKLLCGHCRRAFTYDGSLAGKEFTCSHCRRLVRMPFLTELPADLQEEYRHEQEKLRKKAESAEEKRIRAQQRESEAKRVELLRQQELAQRAEEARVRQKAERAEQQRYARAVAAAKADPGKPKIWHCVMNGAEHGPMKESVLQKWIDDGAITKDDYVLVDGAVTWIRLSDIPERFQFPARVQAQAVPAAIDGHENTVRCPKCGCSQLSTQKKGMSGGTACCGALLVGPLGLLCGLKGANKVIVTCLKCGHQWTMG